MPLVSSRTEPTAPFVETEPPAVGLERPSLEISLPICNEDLPFVLNYLSTTPQTSRVAQMVRSLRCASTCNGQVLFGDKNPSTLHLWTFWATRQTLAFFKFGSTNYTSFPPLLLDFPLMFCMECVSATENLFYLESAINMNCWWLCWWKKLSCVSWHFPCKRNFFIELVTQDIMCGRTLLPRSFWHSFSNTQAFIHFQWETNDTKRRQKVQGLKVEHPYNWEWKGVLLQGCPPITFAFSHFLCFLVLLVNSFNTRQCLYMSNRFKTNSSGLKSQ